MQIPFLLFGKNKSPQLGAFHLYLIEGELLLRHIEEFSRFVPVDKAGLFSCDYGFDGRFREYQSSRG
jgi:hypothetical protein